MNIFRQILNNIKVISANNNIEKVKEKFIAKQININQIPEQLELLQQNKTEFDFIGITSNGDDCIYFAKNDGNFNIEYEAVEKTQLPYLEKMKNFATKNNFQFTEEKNDGIPYFTIFTNSDINETLKLAKQIQSEVFGNNNNNTEYEIVP